MLETGLEGCCCGGAKSKADAGSDAWLTKEACKTNFLLVDIGRLPDEPQSIVKYL